MCSDDPMLINTELRTQSAKTMEMALFALDSALEHSDLLCMCTVVCTLNLCESMAVQWGLLSASCHRCWHNLFSRMPHPALAIYTHLWLIARQCMILSELWTKTQFPSDIGSDTVCLQVVHVVFLCHNIQAITAQIHTK